MEKYSSIMKYSESIHHFSRYFWTLLFKLKKSTFSFNKGNTVVAFTQPRGGSTWFTDLLTTMPGTAKIDGPLYRGEFFSDGRMPDGREGKINYLNRLHFYYNQPIPERAEFEEARVFFDRLFRHRFTTPYIYEETSLPELLSSRQYVFKLYHGNQLLQWLIRHFDITPIVLLRNPFSVVASQLKFFRGNESMNVSVYQLPEFRFGELLDPYRPILNRISTIEEILTARYCMNYLPVVTDKNNNKNWITMSYEGLLINREAEVERLFSRMNRPVPKKWREKFSVPSGSTLESDKRFDHPEQQLSRWKTTLSSRQKKRIQGILDRFEIRGYSREILPDFSYIYNYRP